MQLDSPTASLGRLATWGGVGVSPRPPFSLGGFRFDTFILIHLRNEGRVHSALFLARLEVSTFGEQISDHPSPCAAE